MQYLKERNTYQLLKATCPFKEAVLFQNDTILLFKRMRVHSNA
jgi:hypothetical protein